MSPTDRGTAVTYDVTNDEIELHVMLEGGPPYVLTETEALALSNDLYLVAAARDRAKKAARDAEIADHPKLCGYDRCVLPGGHAGSHVQPDGTVNFVPPLSPNCWSTSGVAPHGYCDLPLGHPGPHQHLDRDTGLKTWPNPNVPKPAPDGLCRDTRWFGLPYRCDKIEGHDGDHQASTSQGVEKWTSSTRTDCSSTMRLGDDLHLCERPAGHGGEHQQHHADGVRTWS